MAGVKKNTLAIGSIIILVFSVIAFVFIPAAGGQAGSAANAMLGKWKKQRLDYTADGLHPDYQAKRYIGETIGGYLEQHFATLLGRKGEK